MDNKPESTEQTVLRLKQMLKEFTDGAIIIGFSVNGDAFITSHAPDQKTVMSLNSMIAMLMHSGGVQYVQESQGE